MHGLARAIDPQRGEHDDSQRVIDGRMAESEPSFESEEYAFGSLLDHTSKGIGPNSSIRLTDSADWAEEFPSEQRRENSLLVLGSPQSNREPIGALDAITPATDTGEHAPLARDHSTEHTSSDSMLRLARRAHALSVKFSVLLAHGGEVAWNAVVHAPTRFSFFGVTPTVPASIRARGQTAENADAVGGGQLWRFVAWMTVPSFCGGLAVGGLTVSLLSGFLPWHSPFEAETQAETRPLEKPAVTVPPLPPPPVKTAVVADVVSTVGKVRPTEPTRTKVEVSNRKGAAKMLNGSDAVARKSETTATRQAQSVVFRGSLAVNSDPPGAQVFVNGEPAGMTPLTLARVPAGSRAVRIELEGYETWSTSARVVANQRTRVAGNLTLRR